MSWRRAGGETSPRTYKRPAVYCCTFVGDDALVDAAGVVLEVPTKYRPTNPLISPEYLIIPTPVDIHMPIRST